MFFFVRDFFRQDVKQILTEQPNRKKERIEEILLHVCTPANTKSASITTRVQRICNTIQLHISQKTNKEDGEPKEIENFS